MNGWIIIAAIALLIIFRGDIRTFFKRLSLYSKLKKAEKSGKCTIHPTHRFWMFGRNRGSYCDFYLEAHQTETVYAVKLWANKHRYTIFRIIEGQGYSVRHFVGFVGNNAMLLRMPIDSQVKPFPEVRFRYKFNPEWYEKRVVNVLLFNPICCEVQYVDEHGKAVDISHGKVINGLMVETLSDLIHKATTDNERMMYNDAI